MNEFEQVPETYQADNEEFNELYAVAWALILKALLKLLRLPQLSSSTEMLQLEREVNSEIKAVFTNLERQAVNMAKQKVTEGYNEGLAYSRKSLSQEDKSVEAKDTKVGTKKVTLNNTHKKRLNKLKRQSQNDLLKATHNTQDNIKQLVRKVVSKEINGTGYSGKIGKRSNMAKRVEKQLRKQFIQNGIKDADVAIIDRANRRWKLSTYSSMAVRTKMNVAYIEAIREESLQTGADLAIISTKPDTKDECLHYEGMIISLNGLTSGYLTYEELKKSKKVFHPNCGHYVRPVAGLEWIPPQLKQKHERQMAKYRAK